jgi:hypothetical protein
MSIIIQAAQFAAKAHHGQLRKWTHRPYIEHPGRVAAAVTLLPGVSDEVIAAAWLHDVLEDCEVSTGELLDEFGRRDITNLVHELTNVSKQLRVTGHDGILPRAERKRLDRERIAKCSDWARRIKVIDRIDNLGELDHAAAGKFAKLYLEESKLLSDAIRATSANDDILCGLLDKLDDTIRLESARQKLVLTPSDVNVASFGESHSRAALDVLDLTVTLVAQLVPPDWHPLIRGQINAAHEAYREATGEPSWDQHLAERRREREAS